MSDATGSASYLMAGFGTSRTEPVGSITRDMLRAKRKKLSFLFSILYVLKNCSYVGTLAVKSCCETQGGATASPWDFDVTDFFYT
jgi:hypothetical protein